MLRDRGTGKRRLLDLICERRLEERKDFKASDFILVELFEGNFAKLKLGTMVKQHHVEKTSTFRCNFIVYENGKYSKSFQQLDLKVNPIANITIPSMNTKRQDYISA
jgi:hypothetical protein